MERKTDPQKTVHVKLTNFTFTRVVLYLLMSSVFIVTVIVCTAIAFAVIFEWYHREIPMSRVTADKFVYKHGEKPDRKHQMSIHLDLFPQHYSEALTQLLDDICEKCLAPDQRFPVLYYPEEKAANAGCYGGAAILVTGGLLEKIETQNELVFVLAHELAHCLNKDHLRSKVWYRLNRFAEFFVGKSELTDDFYNNERAADEFALHVLNCWFGHVGGAAESIRAIAAMARRPFWMMHQDPLTRIDNIFIYAQKKRFKIKETVELDFDGDG